ncbi:MAG: hypothetical protein HY927_09305 [Elusimicrobia bacterium]|nr:hypothetical protein [Elusimicrobiota bacterium]
MKKVLLTSICKPIGEKYGDQASVGYELLHGQVTRSQGMFSPRANHLQYGLEYIAENLQAPTVVLHYPSKAELVRELKKGYDYVGVAFVLPTFHRMKEAVAIIRKHAPGSKVVLGGYGTVLSDEQLKPYADHVCREEGVGFMRRLLGEPGLPVSKFKHPLVTSTMSVFSVPVTNTGLIFGGLGCPHGCDFCCTSHYYKRQHIRLLPAGRDVYGVMERYLDHDPDMAFVILDEDFLINKQRAMEFRDCVIKGGRAISLFVFGSVKALSQYKTSELAEMGIDGLWIGYEGSRSGFAKREGRPASELFQDLREHGIMVLASMILGLDYQTPEIIREEFDGLMALKPSLTQFAIYGPLPGTPLYERVTKESRLRDEYKDDLEGFCRNSGGFTCMLKHPTMSYGEIEGLQRWCFAQDFQRLGPSIYRVVDTWLQGYRTLRDSENPILRAKAERFAKDIRKSYPIFLPGRLFSPNARVKGWIADLEKQVYDELGEPTFKEKAMAVASVGMAAYTDAALALNVAQHPKLVRTPYRMPERGWKDFHVWESLPEKFSTPEFNLRVEFEHARQRVWLRLEGRLAGTQAEKFWAQVGEAMAQRRTQLVFDFKKLQVSEAKSLKAMREKLSQYRDTVRVVMPKLAHAHPELLILAKIFQQYKNSGGMGL